MRKLPISSAVAVAARVSSTTMGACWRDKGKAAWRGAELAVALVALVALAKDSAAGTPCAMVHGVSCQPASNSANRPNYPEGSNLAFDAAPPRTQWVTFELDFLQR